MPYADNNDDFGRPSRTFIYGPDKTKKTWWACRAAEAGYNVLLIDGDDGASITKMLPAAAQKKILVVDVVNTVNLNVFARFIATFMKGDPFIWDEKDKVSYPIHYKVNINHARIYFNPTLFTPNDVIVIDSWTALAASLMLEWAKENNVDLTQVDKDWDQFALMGYQSRFLDFVLTRQKTFNAHVIAIGHETVYEKYEGKGKDRRMVEQKTQPFSSTGPHAKKIGANFSTCLRFSKLSDLVFQINAGGGKDEMGGSRQIEPKKYDWRAISPETIFKAVGFPSTGAPLQGAIWVAAGQEFSPNLSVVTNQSVAPAVAAPAQIVNAAGTSGKISLLQGLKKN